MKIKRYLGFYVLLPIVLELLIESFNRKSIISAFGYLAGSPLLFLFNTLIIMLTLSIAMFFKREIFALVTIALVWVLFGVVNFVILHFRVTPFSAVDFTLIASAIKVSGHYLNMFTIAMIILAIVVLLVGLVCLFIKAPVNAEYSHRQILFSLTFCATLGMAIVVIHRSSNSVQALSTHYTNISEAYENYGFAYCFANSILDTGIDKPEDYSDESVKSIVENLKDEESSDTHPNVIIIQLESFFDVDYVKELTCSQDALPVFHRLEKEYSSGMVTVPTVGAGTVNTEFEVLTGMRQHDFGVSEYPYKTVLKTTAAESICTDLKSLGYTAHAVHNNEGTFYGRNIVFSSLGFDTFASMEFMNGLSDNLNGWCNDDVLTNEIIKTLDSTTGPDFTMAITVQSHGKYEGIAMDFPDITVSGVPEGKEEAFQYYVNQIYEVDKVIGKLIEELNRRDEKTIMVLYGDHLPSLDLKGEDLVNGDLYQTQYVIWDNMGLEKQDKDLNSYELYPETLQRIGIHEGILTKYHQQTDHSKQSFLDGLTMLSYDTLYGENYAYGGESPFTATQLQMGTEKVQLTQVQKSGKRYQVTGKGFTPFCKVYYDGKAVEAVWRDSGCLELVSDFKLKDKDKVEEKANTAKEEIDNLRDVPDAFVVEVQSQDGVVLDSTDVYPASALR